MSAEILRLGLNPGPKPQALHPAPAPPRAQLCTRACSNKHTLQPSNVVGFFCFLVGLFCLSIKIFYIHSNFSSVAPHQHQPPKTQPTAYTPTHDPHCRKPAHSRRRAEPGGRPRRRAWASSGAARRQPRAGLQPRRPPPLQKVWPCAMPVKFQRGLP
jgi:hypothetical protein